VFRSYRNTSNTNQPTLHRAHTACSALSLGFVYGKFKRYSELVLGHTTSDAEELAKKASDADVVAGFNISLYVRLRSLYVRLSKTILFSQA